MWVDELNLAYAVIDGVNARAEAGKYEVERFRFLPKSVTSWIVSYLSFSTPGYFTC